MSEVYLSEVEEQINQYFQYQPTSALAKTSLKSYRQALEGKLVPFCKAKGVKRLDESFIQYMDEYVVYMRMSRCKGQTITSYLTITKMLFKFLGIPLEYSYRIPREDKQAQDLKREKRWFTRHDIALCMTYVFKRNHNRNHALIRIMCETGARLNEIATVKYEDIFLFENKIRLGVSKTVPRTVQIWPETSIYLERFLAKKFPTPPMDRTVTVFPGKNRIYKLTTDMLEDLGIKGPKDGRGPHTFRHFLATYLFFEKEADITDIAYLLGDEPDTIKNHYLHPTPEMMSKRLRRASGF